MDNLIINNLHDPAALMTLFNCFPGSVLLKDTNSQYISANAEAIKLVGYRDLDEFLGTYDRDLRCPAAELAEEFVKQDTQCIQSGEQQNIDICHYADSQLHCFLTKKIPIYDRDKQCRAQSAR